MIVIPVDPSKAHLCEDCGQWDKSVLRLEAPILEIHFNIISCTVCDNCWDERCEKLNGGGV